MSSEAAQKKITQADNINTKLNLVIKSGKYLVGKSLEN